MSYEVCTFCGKSYKRLKTHLHHCKAAASWRTQTKHDVKVNQTSASQPATALTERSAKWEASTQTLSVTAGAQSKKSKNMSVVSSEALSLSSESLPSSTKKKQKLSEQIKTANVPSSTTVSLIHTPPLSPTASKPKRKSLRALIEAAKSKQVSNGSLEETKPPSVDLPSGSAPFVEVPLSSRTTAQTETGTNPDEDQSASKTKASKTKKAAQSLSKTKTKTKDTSSSPPPPANESSAEPCLRDDLWVDNEGEIVDLNENKMLLKSGSCHQARITLKDVKATLGRANTTGRFSRPSILSQIQTADDLTGKPIRPGTSLSPVPLSTGTREDVDSCKSVSDQPPRTSSQHKELQSVKRKSSKLKKIPLISLQHDDCPQPDLTSLTAPLLSGHLSDQVSQAKSLPHTASMKEGLTLGHHVTGLPTVSPPLAQIDETGTNPKKDKSASKTKVLKTKKAAQSLSKTKNKDTSSSPPANESSAEPCLRDDLWVDNEGEIVDLNENKMLLKSGSCHQARITLKDVKATLGRANTTGRFSRPSILSQIQTADDLTGKPIRPGTSLSPVPLPAGTREDVDSCKSVSDQPPRTSSQHKELQSVKRKSSKSKKIPLISLQHDDCPQPELTSLAAPLLSGHLSAQVSQAKSLPHTVSMKEGLTLGHHMTGLPTVSPPLAQIASPRLSPRAPQTLPTMVETLRADNGLTVEKLQLGVRKPNTADNGTEVALTQRSLGQVRLREFPKWLAYKAPSRPRDVVSMVQGGWQWYYKKYIDVKKGGVGGLSMLLAGYCVLSYIWSYPHIKRDRWRRYH